MNLVDCFKLTSDRKLILVFIPEFVRLVVALCLEVSFSVSKDQVNKALVDISALYPYLYFITERIHFFLTTADDSIVTFIKFIEVIGKVGEANHAFAFRFNDLYVNAPLGYPGDQSIVWLVFGGSHEFHLFIFN